MARLVRRDRIIHVRTGRLVYIKEEKPGQWFRLKWYTDNAEPGDPDCICSYCGSRIREDDSCENFYHLNGIHKMRFHILCFQEGLAADLFWIETRDLPCARDMLSTADLL